MPIDFEKALTCKNTPIGGFYPHDCMNHSILSGYSCVHIILNISVYQTIGVNPERLYCGQDNLQIRKIIQLKLNETQWDTTINTAPVSAVIQDSHIIFQVQ